MHISKPRTRFTTSNEVVYLNPDLHRTCLQNGRAYTKTWSGVEPWSGVFFGAVFWSQIASHLRSENDLSVTKWNFSGGKG